MGNDCRGIESSPRVVCAVATNGYDDNFSSREAQEGQKLTYKRSVRCQIEQFEPTAKTVEMRACIGKRGGERREGRSWGGAREVLCELEFDLERTLPKSFSSSPDERNQARYYRGVLMTSFYAFSVSHTQRIPRVVGVHPARFSYCITMESLLISPPCRRRCVFCDICVGHVISSLISCFAFRAQAEDVNLDLLRYVNERYRVHGIHRRVKYLVSARLSGTLMRLQSQITRNKVSFRQNRT